MEVRVFRAGKGDAILLKSETGGHVLIDGGVLEAYEDHLADYLGDMREDGKEIDLVCVSHIDRDHIGGILRLLDNEVRWQVAEVWDRLPDHLKPKGKAAPDLKRPPVIKSIWHNAFFETVQETLQAADHGGPVSADMSDLLLRTSKIYAGAQEMRFEAREGAQILTASEASAQTMFLGLSVGDAVELSRRIGDDQLGIALNPEFGGAFVLRESPVRDIDVAGMTVKVLGPSQDEMDALVATWNEWLTDKADWLQKLIKKHEKDAERLKTSSVDDILDAVRGAAIALAGNQAVTPPNLASIILYVEEGAQNILLTGDADDESILAGLDHAGLMDLQEADSFFEVDVFKIPHHGAHNSYSDELAQRVRARHYVFCGDGAHENPETDVIEDYLKVLYDGKDGHPPVLAPDTFCKFWFNCSEKLAPDKYKDHWAKIDRIMKSRRVKSPGFRYEFKTSGQVMRVI